MLAVASALVVRGERELLQRLLGEGVDALAFGLGHDGQPFVQFRRDAQVELAREVAPGLDAFFAAHIQKDLQRFLELCAKLLWVLAVEIGAAAQAKNLAAKHIQIGVVIDLGLVPVHFHQVHRNAPRGPTWRNGFPVSELMD